MAETQKQNEHQVKLLQLIDTLTKKYPTVLEDRLDSIEELLVAMLMDGSNQPEEECIDTVCQLRAQFIDWNELRVTRVAELARYLAHLGPGEELARRMRELLGRLFDRVGRVSLYHLEEMKPSDAKRALMDIEPVNRDAAARIIMLEIPASSIPFSDEAVATAQKLKIIEKNKNKQQFQKIVEDSLPREKAIHLYYLLEAEAHGGPATKKPKTRLSERKIAKKPSVRVKK